MLGECLALTIPLFPPLFNGFFGKAGDIAGALYEGHFAAGHPSANRGFADFEGFSKIFGCNKVDH